MGRKLKSRKEKYKIGLMAGLLAGACFLSYYFHAFLETCVLVSHVFYIPIILAAVWWGRKGLVVAAFSSVFLIFSHLFFIPDVAGTDAYFRGLMFVVIAFVVGELSEHIGREKEELRAVYKQLRVDEQHLRAANQQLDAGNQQLKAANDQLQASEQQVRAANQQLVANEQQLKAANQQLRAEVAERKKAEEKTKASLREKEVLLKEIHHRVKNNMQVISSILNLQSKHIEDEQALKMFKNGQSRIRSMAMVHEKLYESEDLAGIDFAEYVQSTTSYLFSLHGVGDAVRLNTDIKDISLDVSTAIPCGLIINELVSNSIKHAFGRGREGEILIKLYSDEAGRNILMVKDNGAGFPKGLDFRKTESLGMQLVIMLVEQLGGAIELDRSKGTAFNITFERAASSL
ncbi:MAG: hypothetical protein ISS79_03270 [Phycisphaerae bacterium]|nr:hypothetical protein [Phycisphaerae bacterium]